MSKPQAYLNARQESLRSWRHWGRQVIKTPDFRGTSPVCSETWSAGSHGRVPHRAKVPSLIFRHENGPWQETRVAAWEAPSRAQAPREAHRGGVGRGCPMAVQKCCPGTKGEKAKAQLETATGQEGPLQVYQQQKKDQTEQGSAAQQVEKNSGKGHKKAQTLSGFCLGLYWWGILTGLRGKGLGEDVR